MGPSVEMRGENIHVNCLLASSFHLAVVSLFLFLAFGLRHKLFFAEICVPCSNEVVSKTWMLRVLRCIAGPFFVPKDSSSSQVIDGTARHYLPPWYWRSSSSMPSDGHSVHNTRCSPAQSQGCNIGLFFQPRILYYSMLLPIA
jgi:hypothetical protein